MGWAGVARLRMPSNISRMWALLTSSAAMSPISGKTSALNDLATSAPASSRWASSSRCQRSNRSRTVRRACCAAMTSRRWRCSSKACWWSASALMRSCSARSCSAFSACWWSVSAFSRSISACLRAASRAACSISTGSPWVFSFALNVSLAARMSVIPTSGHVPNLTLRLMPSNR